LSERKILEKVSEALTILIEKNALKVKEKLNIGSFSFLLLLEGFKEALNIKTIIDKNRVFISKDEGKTEEINIYKIDKYSLVFIMKRKILEEWPNANVDVMDEIIKGNIRFIGNITLLMYLLDENNSVA
jgi:hypothetical protein